MRRLAVTGMLVLGIVALGALVVISVLGAGAVEFNLRRAAFAYGPGCPAEPEEAGELEAAAMRVLLDEASAGRGGTGLQAAILLPDGRASASQERKAIPNDFGAHQRMRSSGLVHRRHAMMARHNAFGFDLSDVERRLRHVRS